MAERARTSNQNVIENIISHLQSRNILFVPRFAPYFIASFGAHVFNLMNKQRAVYTEHGAVPDTRMHTLFVAPPGFFKSMLMKILVNPTYGVLNIPGQSNKSKVPMHFESMVTEGGWTGSFYRDKSGKSIPCKGLAEEFSDGIVCFEEFASMTQTMKQSHSLTLDAQLLTSLDYGELRKRMTSGTISYETNISVWAGTQQGRFDLASGLGRRLFFLNWVPTIQEANDLKNAYWNGQNIQLDRQDLDSIRKQISDIVDRVDRITKVEFDPQIQQMLMDAPHFEHRLYARFALGYQIMTGQFKNKLHVTMGDGLRKLISNAKNWREHLLSEAEGDQVIQILIQNSGEAKGSDVVARMLGFGMSAQQTRSLLWRLANRARLIHWDEKKDIITLRKQH